MTNYRFFSGVCYHNSVDSQYAEAAAGNTAVTGWGITKYNLHHKSHKTYISVKETKYHITKTMVAPYNTVGFIYILQLMHDWHIENHTPLPAVWFVLLTITLQFHTMANLFYTQIPDVVPATSVS